MPETSSPEQDWPAREPRGDTFTDPTESAAGQVWREYNLAPYASRALGVAHPEHAVIDWIIRQTGPETWHGEAVAVLSATRGRLRVYHHPDVQAQVAEIVDRFTRPVQPQVSLRVQLASTTDLNWRSGLVHLLRPVAFGADGQHVWLIAPEDASLLRHRLLLDRGSGPQHIMVQNGQSASFETGKKVNYISSLELLGGAYVSYQPVIGRLHDGLQLTFTPLWTKDGSEVDLGFRLVTRSVQKLHQAMGVAPLTSGTQDALLQVPETVATVMEQSLRMSTSQVLLISAGMQPTDSAARRGPFSMSASVAELLLLVELDPPLSKGMKASRDDYYGR